MKKKSLKSKPWFFVFIALTVVTLFYLYNWLSTVNVGFEAVPEKNTVKIGEPFEIAMTIANTADHSLENTDIQINLPNGVIFADGIREKSQRLEIGEIAAEDNEEVRLSLIAVPIAVNDPGTREVELDFNYAIGNLSAKFKQERKIKVSVERTGLSLNTEIPENIISGATFNTVVSYDYEGADPLENLKVQIDYPNIFKKSGSEPKTVGFENVWPIGDLNPGAKGKVTLTGSVVLPDNSDLGLAAKILITILGRDYVLAQRDIKTVVAPSPLSLDITVDKAETSYKPGETVNYSLQYKNNSGTPLNNVVMTAKLSGVMFDLSSIRSESAPKLDTRTNTLIWDSSSALALSLLEPGSGGSVGFSINILGSYPIKRLNDKNFTIKVDATIESPTVPPGIDASKVVNFDSIQNKIAGQIKIDSFGLYRDADSLILNNGSLPPKVGQPTEFTIHWQITNFSSEARDVEIRARLEDGVEFTGVAKANVDVLPVMEGDSGEMVWKLSRVLATTGITGDRLEAVFQVRAVPAPNQAGNYMNLIGETVVRAKDSFTGEDLNAVSAGVTTRLESDQTVRENDGRVIN